ncbi:AsmA-like C-terminal region-containing protein [Candidatus Tisiphia endosymbiont of Nemotelus uliginosus]|uniref:AsmA-like C-terminal region-containing protein n=1 Tax=Candidatus Tisiphia endosymbiont of Nemotelus uliginosus TaxID=3077926 RepID=UPI0035C8EEFE
MNNIDIETNGRFKRFGLMVRRILIIVVVVMSLLACAMVTIIHSIDTNLIVKALAHELAVPTNAIKTVKINNFPTPFLLIDHVQVEGKLVLENVEIHFDIYSLFKLTPKIKTVKIFNATIYGDQQELNIINHDKIISSLLTTNISNINFHIINLTIFNNKHESLGIVSNCHLTPVNSLTNRFVFKGVLDSVLHFSGFVEQKDKQVNFDLTLYNDDYNCHVSEIYNEGKLVSGKGEYIVQNLANVLSHFMPDLKALFMKFNQHQIVKIKFDILPTEQLLQLENLSIDSAAILGTGVLHLSKMQNISSTIKLTFSTIDIPALTAPSDTIRKFSDSSSYGLRFIFDDKILDATISADQIILGGGEILNKTQLLLGLENRSLAVKDFSGTIQSGGNFQLTGNVTQNSVRSIFEGSIYLQHQNLNKILDASGYKEIDGNQITPFTLQSNLKLTLIDIYLQNLLVKTANTTVTGDITTSFIGSMPHIMGNLDISALDLSYPGYPIISPMLNFLQSLTKEMQDETYFTKYIPIRTIQYFGNFNVTINDLMFGNRSFGKVDLVAAIAPGNIEITTFDLRKDDIYLNLNAKLLAAQLKPQLEINIRDGALAIEPLTPMALLNSRNRLLNEFDLNKVELKLQCALSKLSQGKLLLQNLKLALANNNTLFNISQLKADMLGGTLKAAGSILINPYTLNFAYAFNSINLAQLSLLLPKGFLDTYGGMSINGKFSTNGDTIEKLLYNLTTESAFIVQNAKINNLSLDTLVEKVNNKNYTSESLQDDLTTAISQGQTEISTLHGNLRLNKGIALLKDVLFNTKYISGATALAINIYNYTITLTSILTFYLHNSPRDDIAGDTKIPPMKLQLDAKGSIFNPTKTIDDNELKKFLEDRQNIQDVNNV